ncbi:MAG: hypothetical protein HY934_07130 [Candidatus Firestonebacteria bacterium]|nr:hypothetical protein [Candidatus Firestonebacteria bacterium]
MTDLKDKIKFATQKRFNRKTMIMPRNAWEELVHHNGQLTDVSSIGVPLTGVMKEANLIAMTAAGFNNPNPGIDIIRYDEKDHPYVVNIDQYTVVQSFQMHEKFNDVLSLAGLKDSQDLQRCLIENVFIVKKSEEEIDYPGQLISHRNIMKPLKKQINKILGKKRCLTLILHLRIYLINN